MLIDVLFVHREGLVAGVEIDATITIITLPQRP